MIGWVLSAAALAGLVHPLIVVLSRHMRRGLAVLVVILVVGSSTGYLTYGLVNGLVSSTHRLQRAAPAAAKKLERHGRFHVTLHNAHFADRTAAFVKKVPERLQGRTAADALRAAATRGVAFLATGVLTMFFMLYGPQLAHSALGQIRDPGKRVRWESTARAAFRRGFGYARGCLAMSIAAGLLAYFVANRAHVPGAAPLALWVGIWDLVPLIGAVLGAIPIVALAAVASPTRALVLVGVFVAYQLLEGLVAQRWVERRTLHLGSFATVAGGFAGLELYGLGGAIIVLLALAVVVADRKSVV